MEKPAETPKTPADPQRQPQSLSPRTILILIMVSMIVWGAYVAAGAFQSNLNPAFNVWRVVIVMGCVGLFLGFWLLLLWNQGRRDRS